MRTPVLRVDDLHVYYGPSHVLQGVSLEVGHGEAIALLGRNGAGKTTLVHAVAGMVPARRGSVLLDGHPLQGLAPHRIATLGLGLVPQGRRIFERLTVRENLLLGARPPRPDGARPEGARPDGARPDGARPDGARPDGARPEGARPEGARPDGARPDGARPDGARPEGTRPDGGAGAAAGWGLERVHAVFPVLAERAADGGTRLSGGEQQMLAIARALLTNPRLLALDEPSEGLAPVIVARIAEVLLQLKQERTSLLLVEQNLALALAVADRVYIMQKGVIVHADTRDGFAHDREVQHRLLGV